MSIHLDHAQQKALIEASFLVAVLVIAVIVIKKYGNVESGFVGVELNLLTYGFLWDLAMRALNDEEYWTNFPYDFIVGRGFVLTTLCFFNAGLMLCNFKLTTRVKYFTDVKPDRPKARWWRFCVFFLGSVSLCIFLALKVFLK